MTKRRQSKDGAAERRLPRVLNALLGGAIVVGGAIGVGILRTPGHIAGHLHGAPYILLAWRAGGVLALLGANCLAEWRRRYPRRVAHMFTLGVRSAPLGESQSAGPTG